MNKKIITIAEITFALLFIILLALLMGTIMNKGNSAATKLSDTLEMTDSTSLESYSSNQIYKGDAVINLIKNLKTMAGNNRPVIKVKTLAVTQDAEYGFTSKDSGTPVSYNITNSRDDNYINPNGNFRCEVVQNNDYNGLIGEIKFEQVNS